MSYNGWTNYETWAAKLWIDNSADCEEEINEMAVSYGADDANDTGLNKFAVALGEWFEELFVGELPEAGWVADVVGMALREIDWRDIAEHYWDDAIAQVKEANEDEEDEEFKCEECWGYFSVDEGDGTFCDDCIATRAHNAGVE